MAKQGRILDIQGLEYQEPPMPVKKNIRFSNLPKNKQMWQRHEEYLEWDWNTDPKQGDVWFKNPSEGQLEWYEEEIERLNFGEWVMINGEPTYFNKYCYFFHQWHTLQEGIYPSYRDTSLEFFRFYEAVDNDPFTLGICGIKGRRLGMSSMASSIQLLICLLEENNLHGIVSKTGVDAKELYYMIKFSLENLPSFLMPDMRNIGEKELFFNTPAQRVSKNNKASSMQRAKGLNNRAGWLPTAENSYDGRRLRTVIIDECLSPETKLMMGDGVFRRIDEIQVGDYVMTEGGIPRKVTQRFDGVDKMYKIEQPYGKDYVVNSKHRLIVEHRMGGGNRRDGRYIDSPENILERFPKTSYRVLNRVVSKGIEYPDKSLPLPPYLLGAWLGDGLADNMSFVVNHKEDEEILRYLENYSKETNSSISIKKLHNTKNAVRVSILKDRDSKHANKHVRALKKLNLIDNKHIPEEYLTSSMSQRLELLAGIIDTDGHNPSNHKTKKPSGSFDIAMSRLDLIEQIKYLAHSCGLSVSNIRHKKSNFDTDVYKISISGDLGKIPTKVKRKQYINYNKQYNSRRNKIKIIPNGVGRYVGIQVEAHRDEDRMLILEDFTLTMNCAKFEEADVSILFSKISETLVTGASVVGKVLMFSTVNEMTKGGANFKSIWDDSDHVEGKDDMGQTPSRLKRFFIAGYRGVLGYVDQFGNSVIDTPTPEQTEFLKNVKDPTTGKPACPNPLIGAKAYREMRRKALSKDPEKLAEEIRKFPFSWREVFKSASNQCYFNVEDINNQLEKVKEKILLDGGNPEKDECGRRGWFIKMPNGKVKFIDDPKGMWYIHELLPENEANKWEIKFGKQFPSNTAYGAGGLDPFAHAKKAGEGGSDASVTIWKRYSSVDPDNSGMPVAFFIGRPDTKAKFHEQVANGLIYYGVRCLGERAPTDWCDWFVENKLDNYLIETKRKTDGEKIFGLAPQDKQAREEHLTLMVESSYSDHDKIWFRRILEDRLKFDIDDRTDYDGAMSSGMAIMALKEPVKEVVKRETKVKFLRRGKIINR